LAVQVSAAVEPVMGVGYVEWVAATAAGLRGFVFRDAAGLAHQPDFDLCASAQCGQRVGHFVPLSKQFGLAQ
jgi:hypothetical protein